MADASGYEDDAPRIDREYVSPDSTTQAEIRQDLDDAGFPDKAIDAIAGEPGEEGWLVTEQDAWDAVGGSVQDAGSVETELRRDDGVVSEGRARGIAEDVANEINSARGEAAQRVGSDGLARDESGRIIGKPGEIEEQVRGDGIYFRNPETGTEGRAAGFDR